MPVGRIGKSTEVACSILKLAVSREGSVARPRDSGSFWLPKAPLERRGPKSSRYTVEPEIPSSQRGISSGIVTSDGSVIRAHVWRAHLLTSSWYGGGEGLCVGCRGVAVQLRWERVGMSSTHLMRVQSNAAAFRTGRPSCSWSSELELDYSAAGSTRKVPHRWRPKHDPQYYCTLARRVLLINPISAHK
jgi:hypothetical protein